MRTRGAVLALILGAAILIYFATRAKAASVHQSIAERFSVEAWDTKDMKLDMVMRNIGGITRPTGGAGEITHRTHEEYFTFNSFGGGEQYGGVWGAEAFMVVFERFEGKGEYVAQYNQVGNGRQRVYFDGKLIYEFPQVTGSWVGRVAQDGGKGYRMTASPSGNWIKVYFLAEEL